MRSQRFILTVCCLAVFLSFPVFCQAEEDRTGWRLGVTPRLWVSAISVPDEDNVSHGTVLVPLFGGTLSLSPGFAPNVTLLATGFYGKGDGDGVFTDTDTDGTIDLKRKDLEVLLRYSFSGTGFNISAGGRYVEVISEFETDSGLSAFSNRDETEAWFGEIGVGFVNDITEDGRHRMFANLIGLFGKTKSDFKDSQGFNESSSTYGAGGDINIGYQWWVTSFANFSLRYRVFVAPEENDFDLLKFTSIHGPEASIGIVF